MLYMVSISEKSRVLASEIHLPAGLTYSSWELEDTNQGTATDSQQYHNH